MKSLSLIREYVDYQDLKVNTNESDKNMYLTGPFLQGNVKNRNERIYPINILSEAVKKFTENKISKNRALGELNHPPGVEVNLNNVSHRIVELTMTGNNGMGKALILDTPKGQIVKSLIAGGCDIGVSTRGLGKLDENKSGEKVVSEFDLVTIDIVAEPSAPDAYVQAMYEGLQYYIDEKTQEIKVMSGEQKIASTATLEKICETLEEIKKSLCVLPKKEEAKQKRIVDILKTGMSKI